MTEQEIGAIVNKLADEARVLGEANPEDKSEIFRQLGLKLTYRPGAKIVEASINPDQVGFFESVRGGLHLKAHGCSARSFRWSMVACDECGRSGHQGSKVLAVVGVAAVAAAISYGNSAATTRSVVLMTRTRSPRGVFRELLLAS